MARNFYRTKCSGKASETWQDLLANEIVSSNMSPDKRMLCNIANALLHQTAKAKQHPTPFATGELFVQGCSEPPK